MSIESRGVINRDQVERLLNLTREMRRMQRGFFASQPGTPERQSYLRESRRLERDVDKLINELTTAQSGSGAQPSLLEVP